MLVAIVIALWKLSDAVPPLGYTDVVLDRLPSPDGAWVAVMHEVDSEVGMGGDSITATVHLVKTTPPFRDIDLLGVDTGGDASNRPRVAWSAPNGLQVTVGLSDYLDFRNRSVEGLQVDVRFDSDDPRLKVICSGQTDRPPDPADGTVKQ
jgi:hypothetical protein